MSNKFKLIILLLVIIFATIVIMIFSRESQVAPEPIEVGETVVVEKVSTSSTKIIGSSVEGREIETHSFGNGENRLLFVGGVHGGYEWNSILLAYEMIDYFTTNYAELPDNVSVHIIPNLNPDGLYAATNLEGRFSSADITSYAMHSTGAGRFNANDVDLNRNFDCKWAPESSWRGQTVSAGSGAFSEPEAMALRDYVNELNPEAVVFWHSQANNVYASECENGVLPETLSVMNAYATAGDYGAVPVFDAYPITGDAEGWLASINIPAVTVELEGRISTEFNRNLAGVNALLNLYKTN